MTGFELDHETMFTALAHTMGTMTFYPQVWSCPCGSCNGYVLFSRDERAVWLVASHTFEDAEIVRVQGVSCAEAIFSLPTVIQKHCEQDAVFIGLWLAQGLADALADAFKSPLPTRESN